MNIYPGHNLDPDPGPYATVLTPEQTDHLCHRLHTKPSSKSYTGLSLTPD